MTENNAAGPSRYTCQNCKIECDNSMRADSGSAPGEPHTTAFMACKVCADSFCRYCDSLYGQPSPTAMQGWTAVCPECGARDFFTVEVARNITRLNHKTKEKN